MALVVSLLSGALAGTFAEGSSTCLDRGPWVNTALGLTGGVVGALVLDRLGLSATLAPVMAEGLPVSHLLLSAIAGALGACALLALGCACRGFASK